MEVLLENGIWRLVAIWSHRLCLFALSSSLPSLRRTKLNAKPSVSSTPACVFARRPPGVGGISLTRAPSRWKVPAGRATSGYYTLLTSVLRVPYTHTTASLEPVYLTRQSTVDSRCVRVTTKAIKTNINCFRRSFCESVLANCAEKMLSELIN